MLSGNLVVVGLQALNFLLLARALGSAQFGALATINAAAAQNSIAKSRSETESRELRLG